MKLDPRRTAAYLSDPGASKGALVFGDDTGLVRERVKRLIVAVAGSADDPFRVVSLSRETLPNLSAELTARSLTGGRRVVHVADVTDAASGVVQRALAGSTEGFLIVEAGGLAARSKLRVLFEAEREAASIACYPLERDEARALFARALKERGVSIEADALAWVEQRLGQDRARVQADADRLALYLHPDTTASLPMVQLCLGEAAGSSVEDLIYAAVAGNLAETDRALDVALQEGASPVGILTQALGHVTRLHRCAVMVRSGAAAADVMRGLRPGIFYRRQDAFLRSLAGWTVERLARATAMLGSTEFACKQTGAPGDVLARDAMTRLALNSAGRGGGTSRSTT